MPREWTKAAEIMRLYAKKLSTREIADKVGCKAAYVRIVTRQRKGKGASAADVRYRAKKAARFRSLYHSIPINERREISRMAGPGEGSNAIIVEALRREARHAS